MTVPDVTVSELAWSEESVGEIGVPGAELLDGELLASADSACGKSELQADNDRVAKNRAAKNRLADASLAGSWVASLSADGSRVKETVSHTFIRDTFLTYLT